MDNYQIAFSLAVAFCLGYLFRDRLIPYLEYTKKKREEIGSKLTHQGNVGDYLFCIETWLRGRYINGILTIDDMRDYKLTCHRFALAAFTVENTNVEMGWISDDEQHYTTIKINGVVYRLIAPWNMKKAGFKPEDIKFKKTY